jgi:hypothetical protein
MRARALDLTGNEMEQLRWSMLYTFFELHNDDAKVGTMSNWAGKCVHLVGTYYIINHHGHKCFHLLEALLLRAHDDDVGGVSKAERKQRLSSRVLGDCGAPAVADEIQRNSMFICRSAC